MLDTRPLLWLLCALLLLGCGDAQPSPNPDHLPYRFEKAYQLGNRVQAFDLDRDGRDEFIEINDHLGPLGGTYVKLFTGMRQVIEQVNYAGRVRGKVLFVDIDADGRQEILVPLLRNDSLFASLIDATGQKRAHFLVTTGSPRVEPDGPLPWDPGIHAAFARDLDGDGTRELILVVYTAYARLPRGVFVHRMPDGALLGNLLIGSFPNGTAWARDAAGKPLLLLKTQATNNGAVAGGYTDQRSYLIATGFDPAPRDRWSFEVGATYSVAHLAYDTFGTEAREGILAISTAYAARADTTRLALLEPGSGRTLRERAFVEPFGYPVLADLNADTRPEIIMLRYPGDVQVFNMQFEKQHRRTVASNLVRLLTLPDVDGDGVAEIVALTATSQYLFLTPDLKIKAMLDLSHEGSVDDFAYLGLLTQEIGQPPFVLAQLTAGQTAAWRMVANPRYWLHRYGPLALGVLIGLLLMGASGGCLVFYRRSQSLEQLFRQTLSPHPDGWLLLSPKGHLVWANAALMNLLFQTPAPPDPPLALAELDEPLVPLRDFLLRLLATKPPLPQEAPLSLSLDTLPREWRIAAWPVEEGGRPRWLVRVYEPDGAVHQHEMLVWKELTRRVLHDVKNPLAVILLAVQRLQSECTSTLPTTQDGFHRIIDRIEHLRRVTRVYVKLIDPRALNLRRTDLSRFVGRFGAQLQPALPDTLQLEMRLAPDLPWVRLDHEQIASVLENLTDNAQRAMQGTGTLTLTTALALRAPASDDAGTEGFVVLEVHDTGGGIPPGHQERVFDPGYTTEDNGTGLGLAIVKKTVEHHGGVIEVSSEVGIGSIFSIYLPVTAPEALPSGTHP